MAEDVLRLAGFVEGVNYLKQQQTGDGTRPDFTFLLPGHRQVHMDVHQPGREEQPLAVVHGQLHVGGNAPLFDRIQLAVLDRHISGEYLVAFRVDNGDVANHVFAIRDRVEIFHVVTHPLCL